MGRNGATRAWRAERLCTLALLVAGAALTTAAPAWGRSRDFAAAAAPEEPTGPPPPRTSRLFLSLGVSVDAVLADWPQADLRFASGPTQQVGPGLRMAAGVRLVENIAVFVEGSGTVPALPFAAGVGLAGIGVGADWFVRSESPWRLRAQVRRAWGARAGIAVSGVLYDPPPPDTAGQLWLFEAALGHARRAGLLDRGWLVSAFLGPVFTASGAGWTTGLSLGYTWSRA